MRTAIFLLSFFCFTVTQAQVDFGLKAGVNAPNLNIENFEMGDGAIEDLKSPDLAFGFHTGLFLKINAVVLFVQPEVLYTNLNANVSALEPGNNQSLNLNFHRLDIPLLIGKKLGPVRLVVAPVYSVNLSSGNNISEEALESGSFGYQAGVGLGFGKFHIDFKYEGPFGKTASSIIVDNTAYETDMRVSQLIVSMGFDLF